MFVLNPKMSCSHFSSQDYINFISFLEDSRILKVVKKNIFKRVSQIITYASYPICKIIAFSVINKVNICNTFRGCFAKISVVKLYDRIMAIIIFVA